MEIFIFVFCVTVGLTGLVKVMSKFSFENERASYVLRQMDADLERSRENK